MFNFFKKLFSKPVYSSPLSDSGVSGTYEHTKGFYCFSSLAYRTNLFIISDKSPIMITPVQTTTSFATTGTLSAFDFTFDSKYHVDTLSKFVMKPVKKSLITFENNNLKQCISFPDDPKYPIYDPIFSMYPSDNIVRIYANVDLTQEDYILIGRLETTEVYWPINNNKTLIQKIPTISFPSITGNYGFYGYQ